MYYDNITNIFVYVNIHHIHTDTYIHIITPCAGCYFQRGRLAAKGAASNESNPRGDGVGINETSTKRGTSPSKIAVLW